MLVRDGAIAAVGPAAALMAAAPGAAVRDLGSCILSPGLVDAHCHLEWSLLDGLLPPADFAQWLGRLLPLRPLLSADDHLTAARFGALRALEAGTTTVADSGPTGAGAQALAESGLRGLVHLEAFGRETGDAADAAADALLARAAGLDARIGPRGRVGISPHAPYTVGPDYWRGAARAGRRRGAAVGDPPRRVGRRGARDRVRRRPPRRPLRGRRPRARAVARPGPGGAGGARRAGRRAAPGSRGRALRAAGTRRRAPAGRRGGGAWRTARARTPTCAAAGRPWRSSRARAWPWASAPTARRAGATTTCAPRRGPAAGAHAGVHALDAAALLRLITRERRRALGMEDEVGGARPGARAPTCSRCAPGGGGDDPEDLALDPRRTVEVVVVDGEVAFERGVARRGSTASGMRRPRRRGPRAALLASRAVLLDQKRTRRMVQVIAILTSLAFAGVIFVVLGLIFFGGGGSTVADHELSDARALVEERPNDADAWERLASA